MTDEPTGQVHIGARNEVYDAAIEPLRSMLAADGYLLLSEPASGSAQELTLTVSPGPDACEECLVPVEVFEEIARQRLSESGLHPNVTVIYPRSG